MRSDDALAARLAAIFAPQTIVRWRVHDYDQSLELFFAPETPADWTPSAEQLRAACQLGDFTAVYCDFADDTEFVGCWRQRIVDGRKAGVYWVQSQRRERVGYPRYQAGSQP
ncbi:MAG: hypothetical protein RMM29_08625 [Planctomycetota bacterium]|nr:hypothetical protein [Planctomycetota bacterium]MCX8039935.1 hypothetical protein [Planctomycetota bacterium]MDW8373692.1 hypothetical protein [Planctomycetota bacterium]